MMSCVALYITVFVVAMKFKGFVIRLDQGRLGKGKSELKKQRWMSASTINDFPALRRSFWLLL